MASGKVAVTSKKTHRMYLVQFVFPNTTGHGTHSGAWCLLWGHIPKKTNWKEKYKERWEWVAFGGPCQGVTLSKHTTCIWVSARGLLGRGKSRGVKGPAGVGTWDKQTDKKKESKREKKRQSGARGKRQKRVSCVWRDLLKGTHIA